MNMCSNCNKLVPCGGNVTNGGMSHEPLDCDVQSVNKVAEELCKSLKIEIPVETTHEEVGNDEVAEGDKGIIVYASSSSPCSTSHSEEWSDDGCYQEGFTLNSTCSLEDTNSAQEAAYLNLQSPSSVVSAMKGSREKQGIACSKLSVSWSPDVYDPVPTLVSHTVKNNPKRHSKYDKRSGKGKHRGGKASKQSTGKDKKQTHKSSGSAKNCHASLDAHNRILSFDKQSVDFDVGSPEFFASSFLKPSLMKIQMPATEAL